MVADAPYVDIHAHENINEAGVIQALNLSKELILNSREEIKTDFFSVGYHPWWLEEGVRGPIQAGIESRLTHEKFLFLGECGLDNSISRKGQEELLDWHFELAKKIKKPILIFHCVRAYPEIIQFMKKHQFQGKVIFHDYNGNPQITKELLKWEASFSYGKKLFQTNTKGYQSISTIPLKKLFFETDDQSNYSIQEIYQKAGEVLGLPLSDLKEKIYHNFKQLGEF